MSNSLFGKGYEPKESSGGKQLPAGGYIVKIMGAKMEFAKSSGLPMLVISFDISEGEFKNFFHDKYVKNKGYRADAKWSGVARIPAVDAEGNARRGFNSFCGAVEKSNDIKLPKEDTAFLEMLKGKYVGALMGREQYKGTDGKLYWSTKPKFYRSVEAIENGEFDIPEDEYYETPYVPSDSEVMGDLFAEPSQVDSFSALDDSIPF